MAKAFPTHNPAPESQQSAGVSQALYDLKLKMLNTLQSSLDLHETLANFFQMLRSSMPCAGVEYRLAEKNIRLFIGGVRPHTAKYSVQSNHSAVGDLCFYRSQPFSETELLTIETMIGLLIFPLRNALLYKEAQESSLRDPLTQVGNRAALEITLGRQMRLAQRSGQPTSLLVIDIDHFKDLNDRLGHEAGDEALIAVAGMISTSLRQTDEVFRYGGEEFIVVLENTSTEFALLVAERIRVAISQAPIHKDPLVSITASIGVSTTVPEDNRDSLFKRADRAMYRAKDRGRNRVECEVVMPVAEG